MSIQLTSSPSFEKKLEQSLTSSSQNGNQSYSFSPCLEVSRFSRKRRLVFATMALTFLVLGLTTDSLLLTENWIVKWEKNDSPKLKYVEKKHIRREMYLRKDGEILWGSIPNNFTVWEGKDGDFDLGISTAAPTNLKLRRIKVCRRHKTLFWN
mmetsp:Transcript_12827/g.28298  ORF Transcript_12827/g.28298 Transcript_12827/m.28298 type:complete len:153 (+) Transcript_12827:432-890(+)